MKNKEKTQESYRNEVISKLYKGRFVCTKRVFQSKKPQDLTPGAGPKGPSSSI